MFLRRTPNRLLAAIVIAAAFFGACGAGSSSSQPAAAVSSATQPACAGATDWSEASGLIGKRATIIGPVVGATYAATSSGRPTFLDVGKRYPSPGRFSVLVWGSNRGRFSPSPEGMYQGKTICVTGTVTSYRGSPEMEISSPADVTVPN